MLYEEFVSFTKSSGDQLYACCPLPDHQDDTPSFTVNTTTGAWYCHGCNKGGGEVQFIAEFFGLSPEKAQYAYNKYEEKGRLPFPTVEEVKQLHQQLLNRPKEIDILHSYGITDETIEKYNIGWEDFRFVFPILSENGYFVNLRKYQPPHRRNASIPTKKIIQLKGISEPRYYPYEAFRESNEIYVVEGEKDCLVARSQGLNAVTGTGGGTIPTREIHMFKGMHVYLMLDNDIVGSKITEEYLILLRGIAEKVSVIKLPVKDFTDYWMKYHDTNVLNYLEEVHTNPNKQPVQTDIDKTSLSKSEHIDNLNLWMKLDNMCVIGTDPKTYTVPTALKVVCKDIHCNHPCAVGLANVPMEIEADPRQILQFVDSSDSAQDQYLRKEFGCKTIQAEPAKYINAQKILFQEGVSFVDGLEDSTFESRYGIYLYEEQRLTPTVKYNFEACRVTDPRTQQNYYVIRKAEPCSNIQSGDILTSVAYFQDMAKDCTNVTALIEKHYKVWQPTLGIEGRPDLFGAIALTYLSCTELLWRNGVLKGWLDVMVIGDTRTGKSQMVQRFVNELKLGTYINGENARRTGIIGGVQRFGDSWVITWGAIPMNDKGLLIIDEASGLEVADIKELSATRSSGAVTINKIAKGEARARTRLIWLSNPRSGRNLEDFYWKGFGAFMEFIPVMEDQARYDVVLTAAREDVDELQGIKETTTVPQEQWSDLVSYMWNIPKERVLISRDITERIYEISKELEDVYGGGSLVVGVAVHEKLIRIATAIAALRGKIDAQGLHVEWQDLLWAKDFLVSTYEKKSMDYKGYVTEYRKTQKQRKENNVFVRSLCAANPALKVLLSSNVFRGNQVREVLGVEAIEASKIINSLLMKGLLRITGSGAYAPDKVLIDIVKEMDL